MNGTAPITKWIWDTLANIPIVGGGAQEESSSYSRISGSEEEEEEEEIEVQLHRPSRQRRRASIGGTPHTISQLHPFGTSPSLPTTQTLPTTTTTYPSTQLLPAAQVHPGSQPLNPTSHPLAVRYIRNPGGPNPYLRHFPPQSVVVDGRSSGVRVERQTTHDSLGSRLTRGISGSTIPRSSNSRQRHTTTMYHQSTLPPAQGATRVIMSTTTRPGASVLTQQAAVGQVLSQTRQQVAITPPPTVSHAQSYIVNGQPTQGNLLMGGPSQTILSGGSQSVMRSLPPHHHPIEPQHDSSGGGGGGGMQPQYTSVIGTSPINTNPVLHRPSVASVRTQPPICIATVERSSGMARNGSEQQGDEDGRSSMHVSCSTEGTGQGGGGGSSVSTNTTHVAPRDDLQQQQDKKEADERWRQAQTGVRKVKKLLGQLEKAIENEFVDNSGYALAVQKALGVDRDVAHFLMKTKRCIGTRSAQLEEAEKRFRILNAETLTDCSNLHLEEVSDILWAGLQAATVALSKRQMEKVDVQPAKPSIEFVCETMPEPNFEPVPKPQMSELTGKAEHLCGQMIDLLSELRATQAAGYKQLHEKAAKLEEVSARIRTTNSAYASERDQLQSLEKKLDTRLKQINRLSGTGGYADMSQENLSELCKQINKASRKIATEQAIREVRAANATGGLLQGPDKETCMVCFERRWNTTLSPCGHVLCGECSERLNYCPQCRNKIEGRQKCYQP